MPDVKEFFEAATKSSRPAPGALERQHVKQRARRNRKRAAAMAAAAVFIAVAAGAYLLAESADHGQGVAGTPHVPAPAGAAQAVVVGLDGSIQRLITGLPAGAGSLTVSPNGGTWAFVLDHGGIPQLATIRRNGTHLRFLTHMTLPVATPSWSPDGSRIAFVAGTLRGETLSQSVFVVNADGTRLRRLTSMPSGIDQWPSWSPDGSTIAFSNTGTASGSSGFTPTQRLWTVPADGGHVAPLAHPGVYGDMPAFDPGVPRIAFVHDGEIKLIGTDGGATTSLAGQSVSSRNFSPRWSPDGSRVAYLAFTGSMVTSSSPLLTVHILDVATGTDVALPVHVVGDLNAVSWLPSGQALLVDRYPG